MNLRNIFLMKKQAFFSTIISIILFSNLAHAGQQTFTQDVTSTKIDTGETLTFNLKTACSGNDGCGELTIIDDLPDGLTIETCPNPSGFTVTCNNNSITLKRNPFNSGDSLEIKIKTIVDLEQVAGTNIKNDIMATITTPADTNNSSIQTSSSLTVNSKTPNWSVEKIRTSPSTDLKPTWDTDVSYSVKFCSEKAIGNVGLTDVMMNDIFPDKATVISSGGGTASGNKITWDIGALTLKSLYPDGDYGSKKCISKNYVLTYPHSDFTEDTNISNSITATGTPVNGGDSITETKTLDGVIGIPTPGAFLSKWASDVLPSTDLNWGLNFNVNNSNAPVPDLVIYETLPSIAGVLAKSVSSGQWNSPPTTQAPEGSLVKAKISFSKDSAVPCKEASYTDLSAGFIASPSSSIVYSLDGTTTCIKWEFKDEGADGPAVPRGWKITTFPRVIQDTTGYTATLPVAVKNCLNATFKEFNGDTGDTGAQCATANIEESTPEIAIQKTVDKSELKPGDKVQYTLRFYHDRSDSTGATVNPVVTDLLPEQMEFVSWDAVEGLSGKRGPNLEKIDNYDETGRTLLRFSWRKPAPDNSVQLNGSKGVDNAESFEEGKDIKIKFTVRVKAGTLAKNYSNSMQFFDNSDRHTCNNDTVNNATVEDSDDLDGDGDKTEKICSVQSAITVLEAAVLGGSKWIRGIDDLGFVDKNNPSAEQNAMCPNDNGFTRYPCVAQTLRGENFDYLFKLQNIGNKNLKDYIFYDIFPFDGDTGVSELLSTTSRGTKWRPILQSPVTTANNNAKNSGSVIEYSTASNPCRPEVSSSSIEDGWQNNCVDDWGEAPNDLSKVTAFRIKIPFNDTFWEPIVEMQFKATMKAPTNALLSRINDKSKLHPAWNAFAHRATRADDNDRLLTAEPPQVGIVVPAGPPVSIGSIAWIDANNNGIQDSGEGLITDTVTFKLVDKEGNSVKNNDNQVVAPISSTNGTYLFDNLPEGNYSVVVTPPDGYIPSAVQNENDDNDTCNDSNIKTDNGDGSYTSGLFELTDNGELIENDCSPLSDSDNGDGSDDNNGNMTVDFGFYKATSIGDTVWYDKNANGIQDEGEDGVKGITVYLHANSCDNTSTISTITNDDGEYQFTGLTPKSYCIQFDLKTLPDGYSVSPQNIGDNFKDSDAEPSSGKTEAVTLAGGSNDPSWDMGLYKPASIGNRVWLDNNANGIQDEGETNVAGVHVTLYKGDCETVVLKDNDGTDIAVQITDENGLYAFSNLIPNDYCLGFSNIESGYGITNKENDANSSVGSNVNVNNNKTDSINLESGEDDDTVDMGIYKLATLGDRVWLDSNANGVQEDGEDGVKGVVVTLYTADCETQATTPSGDTISTVNTDENGLYSFKELVPNEYCIGFSLPDGYKISPTDGGTDDEKDSDVNSDIKIPSIVLNSGDNDESRDMGIYQLGSIGDFVWNDINVNGIQEDNEEGIAGVTVTLYSDDCKTLAKDEKGIDISTQSTDGTGHYSFTNLVPNTYCIGFELPDGFSFSSQNIGSDDTIDSDVDSDTNRTEPIILRSGDNNLSFDAGIYEGASLGNKVWYDTNRDGLQGDAELPVSGVKVTLLKDCETEVTTTTTNTEGEYLFSKLPPAEYCVQFGALPTTSHVVTTSNIGDDDIPLTDCILLQDNDFSTQ